MFESTNEVAAAAEEAPVTAKTAKKKTAAAAEFRVELGNKKFLSISEWNKQTLVQIREYYEDKETGEMKPGKKGIALKLQEFEQLKKLIPQIDRELANK